MARTIGVKMCICNWFTFLNNYFSCLFFCFGLLFKSSCISCSLSIDLCNLLNGEFPACFSHIFVVAPPSTCACSRLSAFVLLVFLVWLLCHPHPALSWMTSPHHPPPIPPFTFQSNLCCRQKFYLVVGSAWNPSLNISSMDFILPHQSPPPYLPIPAAL